MPVTGLKLSILAVVVAALTMAPAAWGTGITFTLGNHPQPGEENVLLNNGTTGTTVFGVTNITHTTETFTSSQTLNEPSSGQARIEAISATGSHIGLTNITISLAGHTFTDLIFNPSITGTVGVPGGTLNVSVTDIHGNVFPFSYTLGNGNNFLTIVATGGDRLVSASLQYSLSAGFTDLRQIRLSGIATVPEPGAELLLGLGTLGLMGLATASRKLIST
jgi:hypothetical protein